MSFDKLYPVPLCQVTRHSQWSSASKRRGVLHWAPSVEKETRGARVKYRPYSYLEPPMINMSRPSGIIDSFGSRRSVPDSVRKPVDSQRLPFSDKSSETITRTLPLSPAWPFASRKVQYQRSRNRIRSVVMWKAPRSQMRLTERSCGLSSLAAVVPENGVARAAGTAALRDRNARRATPLCLRLMQSSFGAGRCAHPFRPALSSLWNQCRPDTDLQSTPFHKYGHVSERSIRHPGRAGTAARPCMANRDVTVFAKHTTERCQAGRQAFELAGPPKNAFSFGVSSDLVKRKTPAGPSLNPM